MEINATAIYDLRTIKAMVHLQLFGKAEPKKRMIMWGVLYAVLAAVLILRIWAYGSSATLWLMLAMLVLIELWMLFMYFVMPTIQYNATVKLADIQNSYVFKEDELEIASSKEGYSGEVSLKYNMIFRVMETGEFLFIFQNKTQVYIVDKRTIEGGSWIDVRNKLEPLLGKKYIICRY